MKLEFTNHGNINGFGFPEIIHHEAVVDFGLVDSKGRKIGVVVHINEHANGDVRVCVFPARDGKMYGGSASAVTVKDMGNAKKEAFVRAEKYLKRMRKLIGKGDSMKTKFNHCLIKKGAGFYITFVNRIEVQFIKSEDGKSWNIYFGQFGDENYWSSATNTLKEAREMLDSVKA